MAQMAPGSKLTFERPDLWRRAMEMAQETTGHIYVPKLPLADGTIYACGGGGYGYSRDWNIPSSPPPPKTIDDQIRDLEREIARIKSSIVWDQDMIKKKEKEIAENEESLKQKQSELTILERLRPPKKPWWSFSPIVTPVPEGAMEWLLHEVGHHIAASEEDRLLPNYGGYTDDDSVGRDREWQAWAFEDIVLSRFGTSRLFAPPSQRDGIAFDKGGSIPRHHIEIVGRKMHDLGIDPEPWRELYGEWVQWHGSITP